MQAIKKFVGAKACMRYGGKMYKKKNVRNSSFMDHETFYTLQHNHVCAFNAILWPLVEYVVHICVLTTIACMSSPQHNFFIAINKWIGKIWELSL